MAGHGQMMPFGGFNPGAAGGVPPGSRLIRTEQTTTRTQYSTGGGAGAQSVGLAQFTTLRELAGKLGADQSRSLDEARAAAAKLATAQEDARRLEQELQD